MIGVASYFLGLNICDYYDYFIRNALVKCYTENFEYHRNNKQVCRTILIN